MFVITAALLATLSVNHLRGLRLSRSARLDTDFRLAASTFGPFSARRRHRSDQGSQPARRSRPPDTDETVAVSKGARLSVNSFAGEVQIRGWDSDSVRVQAYHNVPIAGHDQAWQLPA